MIFVRMSAGLALLTLGLGVWRAWGQQVTITECGDLKTEIEGRGTSFVLGQDIICDSEITITNEVTIDGAAEFTLQIDPDFVHGEDRFAAIYNEGTLTLTGLTMTVDDEVKSGFRAIYNEGDLTVNSCNFNGFNLLTEPLEDGGVVSRVEYLPSPEAILGVERHNDQESHIFSRFRAFVKSRVLYFPACFFSLKIRFP